MALFLAKSVEEVVSRLLFHDTIIFLFHNSDLLKGLIPENTNGQDLGA